MEKKFVTMYSNSPFPFKMLPMDLQKQAKYLTKNPHAIEWNVGTTPLLRLKQIIEDHTSGVDYVYVKGRKMADFIRQYISVLVLELEEIPALQKGSPKCFTHAHNYCMCALSDVFKLYETFIMH